jgi:hypothetical protein
MNFLFQEKLTPAIQEKCLDLLFLKTVGTVSRGCIIYNPARF